jgi:prepilin-type processing-associated H-X9-DG protein
MRGQHFESGRITTLSFVLIIVLFVGGAVMYAVLTRSRETDHRVSCQSSLKEVGLYLQMYCDDYGGMLPSSALTGGTTWSQAKYWAFATLRGILPPPQDSLWVSWPMVLYPFMKNRDNIWCPQDTSRRDDPNATVSYWYKAAVDRAWFGGKDAGGKWSCKRLQDFKFPAEQIAFYEHTGWHWGDEKMGLSEGAAINVVFLDGHVKAVKLRSAGNAVGESDPVAPGEPGWFAYDCQKKQPLGVGTYFDPRTCGDRLP